MRYVYATVYETESKELVLVNKIEVVQDKVVLVDSTLERICGCESRGNPNVEPRQFNSDGTVLRGVVNSQDIGMCQINLQYHGESAEMLGYDLFTEEGNISYANHLYSTQGSQPWYLSEHCWS